MMINGIPRQANPDRGIFHFRAPQQPLYVASQCRVVFNSIGDSAYICWPLRCPIVPLYIYMSENGANVTCILLFFNGVVNSFSL